MQGSAIAFSIERPPPSEHANIAAEEEARASEAVRRSAEESPKIGRLSLGKQSLATPKEDPLSSLGMELSTITLLRIKDDPLSGIEVGDINEVAG